MTEDSRPESLNPYSPPAAHQEPEVVVAEAAGDYPLELDYDVQIRDLVDLSVFHHSRSHLSRRSHILSRALVTLLLLLLAVPLLLVLPSAPLQSTTGSIALTMVIALPLLALGHFFFFPALLKRRIRGQVSRMYAEGSNASILGTHHMVVSPDGIVFETRVARHDYKWPGIERIELGETAVYFYLSAVSAQIVPLRSFDSDQEVEQFLKRSRQYLRNG